MSRCRLRFLGVGDSESMNYWNTNLLLETEGGRLLIDCGYTIKYALRDVGLTLADIDAILITHVHADHVFGLERFGYEMRYSYRRRIPLMLEPNIMHTLWDQTLKGCMGNSSDGDNRLEDFFNVYLINGHTFDFEGCRLRTFRTKHTPGMDTYGLVFDDDVIFTADSKPLNWLASDRSDRLILHDCSLQEHNPVHATLRELIRAYPRQVRNRLLAIHYGDDLEIYRSLIEQELGGVAEQGKAVVWG